MNLILTTILFILIHFTKRLYCFSNDENVWKTIPTNNDFKENVPKFSPNSKQLFDSGKDKYELWVRDQDIYGNCWTKAILSLKTNCRQLNDEIQSRLALSFANCFLQRSGQRTYPCDQNQDIKECLKDMEDRAFNSYNSFFTHTQSVCFYLQSEYWQQITESTIDRLTETSVKVKDRLEDASDKLDQLNGLQELSIGSQMRLNDELIAARNNINEFKSSSAEQRFIVKEILDRFIRLQDFVLVEISYGYSLLYFFVSMIIIYFITTPVRTNEARLWLFLILLTNLCVERLIATHSVEDQNIGLNSTSIIINERIWISRKITLCLLTAILLWFAITYKNYGRVNYNILNEHSLRLKNIENQLSQLLRKNIQSYEGLASLRCMDQFQKGYISENDSDFTDDSDYNTNGSESSADTCSTVAIMNPTTTNKTENKENIKRSFTPIQTVNPNSSYELRPRKAITYTKNGIITESVDDFINQIKVSEKISKTKRNIQHFNSFMSSGDD